MRTPIRRRTLSPSLLVPFVLALAPAAAAAQEVRPLTLEEALATARLHNPAFRKAGNAVGSAGVTERERWATFLPELSSNLRFGGSSSRVVTGENDFGEPVMLPEARGFVGSSTSQGISASLTVFDGGRALAGLRAARAEARGAAARAEAEGWRLRTLVAERYYAVLQARRRAALEERLLAPAREQLDATEQLLRVAARHPEDVIGARLALATQERALEAARAELARARLLLREAMGVPDDVAYDPVDDLPPVFDPTVLDEEAIVAAARAASPAVRAAEASAEAARRSVGLARAAFFPQLSLSAGVSRGMSLSSYEAIGELNPRNRSFSFGLSATLPLFDRMQAHSALSRAGIARESAEEDVRAARLAAERDARNALIDLRAAHRAAALAEESAQLGREWLAMATERYALGALSFTELQNVIDRAARAERDAEQARLDFARALLALEERAARELAPPNANAPAPAPANVNVPVNANVNVNANANVNVNVPAPAVP